MARVVWARRRGLNIQSSAGTRLVYLQEPTGENFDSLAGTVLTEMAAAHG